MGNTLGMAQVANNTFKESSDMSANLSNHGLQFVDIFHVPSGHSVNFKAMMTEFSDSYTSDWNSEAVFGRMDPLQTFRRTGRKITAAFDVVAGSLQEAKDNLDRISILIQFLYPSYSAGLIKNSPFCKIQFMNWASNAGKKVSNAQQSGLLGSLEGFTFSPGLDSGVFVGLDKEIYPKILNVNLAFTVVHEHNLGWHGKSSRYHQFPYHRDISPILKGKRTLEFPAPAAKAQQEVVPQDEKNGAAAAELTGAQMRSQYKAEQAQKNLERMAAIQSKSGPSDYYRQKALYKDFIKSKGF